MSATDSSAILPLVGLEVNWRAIEGMDPKPASEAVRAILGSAEAVLAEAETRLITIRDRIFNLRMVCFRIVSERELWKLDNDPEYGIPYKSMFRWMQVLYPNDEGLRYAIEANSTQKALPAATIEDLSQMKRVNAVQLASKYVSDACRKDPAVIEATKTASEKEFRETLNRDHGQKLERPVTLKLTYPAPDMAKVKAKLSEKAKLLELDESDYAGALLGWVIDDDLENAK